MDSPDRRLRDALWIAAVGIAVASAPIIWAPLAWESGSDASAWSLLLILFEAPPFVFAAVLRARGQLGRVGAAVATAAASGWVVFGQVLGLNPNDPSSTAALGLLIGPFYGVPTVASIWLLAHLARAVRRRRSALRDRLGG